MNATENNRRRRQRLVSVSLFAFPVSAVLAVCIFGSSTPAGAGQQVPKFGELAVGHFTGLPTEKDRPTSIPAAESVPGLRILTQGQSASPQMLVVVSDAAAASRVGAGGSNNELRTPPTTVDGINGCYSQMSPVSAASSVVLEWENNLSHQASIWLSPSTRSPVAIHHERVVEQATGGGATLESTDAWLDPQTHGLRLIARGSVPLKQIGSAPGGVRFFAGRDDRADGKRFVQFVATRAKDTPFQEVQNARATRGDGSVVSAGACSHHRVSVAINNSKSGLGGENAVLQFNTVLPDLAPGEHSNAPPLPSASPGQNIRDVRARAVHASFSVSQTSRDKEPILSLSTSWASAEMNQRIFNASPTNTGSSPGLLGTSGIGGIGGVVGTVSRPPTKVPRPSPSPTARGF